MGKRATKSTLYHNNWQGSQGCWSWPIFRRTLRTHLVINLKLLISNRAVKCSWDKFISGKLLKTKASAANMCFTRQWAFHRFLFALVIKSHSTWCYNTKKDWDGPGGRTLITLTTKVKAVYRTWGWKKPDLWTAVEKICQLTQTMSHSLPLVALWVKMQRANQAE